ncbi:MAG: hypothetical protein RBU27_12635 [Bacteroidota bacterium]|jgi:DNA-binding beta-propeller fold protein YncE|nr:hypothetical protein [Bacteroidota bacterium]
MRFALTLLIGLFAAMSGRAQTGEPQDVWIEDTFAQPELSTDWKSVSGTWTCENDIVRVSGGSGNMAMLHGRYLMNSKPYVLESTINKLGGGLVFNAERQGSLANSHIIRVIDGGVSIGYIDFGGNYIETRTVTIGDLAAPVKIRAYIDQKNKTFSLLINDRNVALEELRFNSGYAGLHAVSSGVGFEEYRVLGHGMMDIPAYFVKSNKRQLDNLSYFSAREDGLLIVNPTVGIVQRITSVGTYVSEISIEEKTELRGVAADEKYSYVVDAVTSSLRIFDTNNKLEKSISTDLDDPRDVAVDDARIYVLDNNGVAVFDKNLSLIKRYAGGLFRDPKGIFVMGDRVYVADYGNGQVQVLRKSDFTVEFVIKDDLVNPHGVTAHEKTGDIYVADPGAVAVLHYDKDGGFIERIDPITIRGFISPRDVLLFNNMVYVADFDRILGFREGVLTIRPSLRID